MREKIFMFLFFFTILLSLFIYVNGQKVLKQKESKINKLQAELEACQKNQTTIN